MFFWWKLWALCFVFHLAFDFQLRVLHKATRRSLLLHVVQMSMSLAVSTSGPTALSRNGRRHRTLWWKGPARRSVVVSQSIGRACLQQLVVRKCLGVSASLNQMWRARGKAESALGKANQALRRKQLHHILGTHRSEGSVANRSGVAGMPAPNTTTCRCSAPLAWP